MAPTVPKLMSLPFTVPVMLVGELPRDEISMVPLRLDPDCCQVKVNVPLSLPLYSPDHVPDSPPADGAIVDGVVLGAVAADPCDGAADPFEPVEPLDVLEQPTAVTAIPDSAAVRSSRVGSGCVRDISTSRVALRRHMACGG